MSDNNENAFDDVLTKIAGKISGEIVIEKLGKNLGFDITHIGRFNRENAGGSSIVGTLKMLREWLGDQKVAEAKKILKAALEKSGLRRVADIYLSAAADDVEQHVAVQGTSFQSPRKEDDKEEKPARKDYTGLEMKKAVPTKEQLDPEKNYKMDVLAKGHMFILNMTKNRKGSAADVENIVHVFEQIGGFKIESHSDLTAKDLKDKLKKFVDSPHHKDMSSAVFLLMGHGSKTGVQCTDEEVTTEFISDMVSRMEHMNGKPKMIFFQCCRGNKREKKVETDEAQADIVIPAKSDFLQVYATTEGNVAYRDEDDGSWFIQMLCEELLENAHASDLCTMLEQVTGKVGKMYTKENHGQCVVVVKQGISKKIYFLPKYSPKA